MIKIAEEIGLKKIALFPEKVKAIDNLKNSKEMDLTYPISVEVSPTHICNHSCIWCSDRGLKLRSPNALLDKEVMFKLFEDLKAGGTKGIVIEGGGEPTCYKDFVEIIKKAHEVGLSLGLATNGYLYNYEEVLPYFQWIRISLDASSPMEYIKIKGVDGFDTVMSNIKKICEYKKKHNLQCLVIGISYVVSTLNLGNLEKLVRDLKDIGVNYMYFRPVIDHPHLVSDINLDYLHMYNTKDFTVMTKGMEENVFIGNEGFPCIAHSLSCVITSEGDVHLCGRLNVYEWFNIIGNVNEQDFKEIWEGEKRKEQAMKVLDPEFCKKYCLQCRMTKFNKLFYKYKIEEELNKISKEELDLIKTKDFI